MAALTSIHENRHATTNHLKKKFINPRPKMIKSSTPNNKFASFYQSVCLIFVMIFLAESYIEWGRGVSRIFTLNTSLLKQVNTIFFDRFYLSEATSLDIQKSSFTIIFLDIVLICFRVREGRERKGGRKEWKEGRSEEEGGREEEERRKGGEEERRSFQGNFTGQSFYDFLAIFPNSQRLLEIIWISRPLFCILWTFISRYLSGFLTVFSVILWDFYDDS